MHVLDMRTVLLGYVLSNAISAIVMASLWAVNRRHFQGLGYWFADFLLQFVATILLAFRGTVFPWFSILTGGPLIIGGALLLYAGLARYVAKAAARLPSLLLLGSYIALQAFFTFGHQSLQARNILLSLALLAVCTACVRLMMRVPDARLRKDLRLTSLILGAFVLVSFLRIFADLLFPPGEDLLKSGLFDVLTVLCYQMLYIGLTFALHLMVNRRLVSALESDIAERERVEVSLRESEGRYRHLFEVNSDALFLVDEATGGILDANASATGLYGYGRDELRRMGLVELSSRVKEERSSCEDVAPLPPVAYHRRKDGSIFPVEANSTFFELNGRGVRIADIRDISEHLAAQGRIRRYLEEKELLLKETHHRIKNNMNTVHSLLSIQADRQEDGAGRAVLHDAARRVQAMATLYDKLYRSESYRSLGARVFLEPLVSEIVGVFPALASLRVATEIDDLALDVKRLSSLGIIVNELITNTMKYAFGQEGEHLIRLSLSAEGRAVTMCYADNGSGLPEGLSLENSTGFGMQLVLMVVKELGGSVRVNREAGTEYVIVFEAP
jgi:PAS domain S-box-containing protein